MTQAIPSMHGHQKDGSQLSNQHNQATQNTPYCTQPRQMSKYALNPKSLPAYTVAAIEKINREFCKKSKRKKMSPVDPFINR